MKYFLYRSAMLIGGRRRHKIVNGGGEPPRLEGWLHVETFDNYVLAKSAKDLEHMEEARD